MKKIKVIDSRNIGIKNPVLSIAVIVLILDRGNAPEWQYGVIYTLALIWLIIYLIDLFNRTEIDIFKTPDISPPNERPQSDKRPAFTEKLDKMNDEKIRQRTDN